MSNSISLNDFLKKFPHVFVANESDNQDIINFYHQTKLSAKEADIIYLRGNDFFAFLKERSEKNIVLMLKDDLGNLQGLGVLSFRPGYINQELTTVGYLGDLRVRMNRKLIREWREMYSELIRQSPNINETQFCSYYQTVLIEENHESRNNLAMNRIPHLLYHQLASYKMINVWGRIKLFNSKKLHISFALETNHQEIINFLTQSPKDQFGHSWENEFPHRLSKWSNFNYSNYIIVRDEEKKIIAITSFWNPKSTKQVQINKISPWLKIGHQMCALFPLIDLKPLPKENQNIDILYINQLIFDEKMSITLKKEIVTQIFHFVFNQNFHLLAYADYTQDQFFKNNYSFFLNSIKMSLHTVHYQDKSKTIHFPLENKFQSARAYFDMALV